MAVGSGGRYVVCGFFAENPGKFSVFCWEGFLRFGGFSLHGKVSGHGQLIDGGQELRVGEARPDPVDGVGKVGPVLVSFWSFNI